MIKKKILGLLRKFGVEEPLIKMYFTFLGRKHNLSVKYNKDNITIENAASKRRIIVALKNLPYLIDIINEFDYYFGIVLPEKQGEWGVVNYSAPRLHTLSSSLVEFKFSTFPESDDVTDIYLNKYEIKPGDAVVDMGSFCGSTVYSFSKKVGPTGKVFAIEADPGNFEALTYNIKKHNLTNVVAINKAIWSSTTTLKFQAEGNMGSAIGGVSSRDNGTIDVQAISFNDFLKSNHIEKVDFVKMDIEGSEVEVVNGMVDYLKKHKTPMIIEVHQDGKGISTQVPLDVIFKKLNLSVEYIPQKGTKLLLLYVK